MCPLMFLLILEGSTTELHETSDVMCKLHLTPPWSQWPPLPTGVSVSGVSGGQYPHVGVGGGLVGEQYPYVVSVWGVSVADHT